GGGRARPSRRRHDHQQGGRHPRREVPHLAGASGTAAGLDGYREARHESGVPRLHQGSMDRHAAAEPSQEDGGDGSELEREPAHFFSHAAASASMNFFVPSRPLRRIHTGPPSRSKRSSMSKNGQQRRSCSIHSASNAIVFASDGKRNSYPFGSSRTPVLSERSAGPS